MKFCIIILLYFFIFCKTPYKYLISKFEYQSVEEETKDIYQDNFLFIEDPNECVEYQIIFDTPLSEPFFFLKDFQDNRLYEKQFLWVRVYLKNKSVENLKLSSLYLLKNNEKVLPYNFDMRNFIKKYPMFLNEKPLFWYLIPKDPALYFFFNNEWWKDFYTSSYYPKYNFKKIEYYSEYFSNLDWFQLEPEKEVLFFVIFPNLIEDNNNYYTLIGEWGNCKIEIPFLYKIEAVKEFKQKRELEKIIQKLRKQNQQWQSKLEKQLRNHTFQTKYFLDFLFED